MWQRERRGIGLPTTARDDGQQHDISDGVKGTDQGIQTEFETNAYDLHSCGLQMRSNVTTFTHFHARCSRQFDGGST